MANLTQGFTMTIAVSTQLDLSGLEAVKKKLKHLEKQEVEWGFLGGTHSDSGLPYAYLAYILEFGGKSSDGYTIPPRPAFRESVQNLRLSDGFRKHIAASLERYLTNSPSASAKPFLEACGAYLKDSYHDSMVNWHKNGSQYQSNARWTILEKGFDQPYVDSGELVQNVEYQIV